MQDINKLRVIGILNQLVENEDVYMLIGVDAKKIWNKKEAAVILEQYTPTDLEDKFISQFEIKEM